MKYLIGAALAAAAGLASTTQAGETADPLTRAIQTGAAAKWNQPQEPARIYGHTYYVGVAGLSSVLIHTDSGSILLDGDLPQSASLIEANIRKLGFRVEDIRFILNSHAHFDHAGGMAALQRDSGAEAVASPSGAAALHNGQVAADDPQAAFIDLAHFPAVTKVREIRDGEALRVGSITIIAHAAPGHTPGSTSWSWRDCEGSRCLDIVYADSLNPVSAPGFHFLADATHADLTETLRKSMRMVESLPCDILITVHTDLAGIPQKLKGQRSHAKPNPFIDAQACRNYAREAEAKLDARIAEETAAQTNR
jgi:metallo-beta-lactamase class B